MTIMRVWQCDHADGTPREIWAAVVENGALITRFGAVGQKLRGGEPVSLKGATANARLREMEGEKRNGGYRYLGEYEVSDQGEIDWSASTAVPQSAAAQPKASGFISLLSVKRALFSESVAHRLEKCGVVVTFMEDSVKLAGLGEEMVMAIAGGEINFTVKESRLSSFFRIMMAFLAKRLNGQIVDPMGQIIVPSFNQGGAWANNLNAEAMELVEALELVPRALSKSLKPSAKKGLFAF